MQTTLIFAIMFFIAFFILLTFGVFVMFTCRRRSWGLVGLVLMGVLVMLGFSLISYLSVRTKVYDVHEVPSRRLSRQQVDDLRLELEAVARRNAEGIRFGGEVPVPPTPPPTPESSGPVAVSATPSDDNKRQQSTALLADDKLTLAGEVENEAEFEDASRDLAVVSEAKLTVGETNAGAAETKSAEPPADEQFSAESDVHDANPSGADPELRSDFSNSDPMTAETHDDLPKWVSFPPSEVDGARAEVIESDPFEDRFACDLQLDERTRELIRKMASQRCRRLGLQDVPIGVSNDLLTAVIRERHYQKRSTSVGDMLQGHQLTVLDDGFQQKLDQVIQDATVERRLATTGFVSGCTLMLVASLFGVFRFASRKDSDPLSA